MKKVIDLFFDGESSEHYKISFSNFETRYAILIRSIDSERIMYDDEETIKLYQSSVPNFEGDVLVVGLGFGLLGYNFAKDCNSFDYLEIDKNLINFIRPKLPNLNYFVGDAFTWQTDKKYDAIFLDIFHKMTDEYESQIIELYNKYKMFLKPGGEISYLTIHYKKPI